jgi:hypothetical protein
MTNLVEILEAQIPHHRAMCGAAAKNNLVPGPAGLHI